MNPWAFLIVVVAVLCFIVGWKGTQDNVIAALLNKPYKKSTTGSTPTYTPGFADYVPGSPSVSSLPVVSA